jgi:hypothetical protein
MDKEEIRPFYSELQGYLSQTPHPENTADSTEDSGIWQTFNEIVDSLVRITKDDLNRLKIVPTQGGDHATRYEYLRVSLYRQKLGGLISYLHGKYFSDEPAPFSGSPHTVVTQSQTQEQAQSAYIQILLDLQSNIDEKIREHSEDTKEGGFLRKLKGSLSTAKNISEILTLVFSLAKEFGIDTNTLSTLF